MNAPSSTGADCAHAEQARPQSERIGKSTPGSDHTLSPASQSHTHTEIPAPTLLPCMRHACRPNQATVPRKRACVRARAGLRSTSCWSNQASISRPPRATGRQSNVPGLSCPCLTGDDRPERCRNASARAPFLSTSSSICHAVPVRIRMPACPSRFQALS